MKKLLRVFKNLDLAIMCFFLAVVFIVLFLQVFCRYALGRSLTWSEEIARYSYVWITMIALGYNVRTMNNISMTLFMDKMPRAVNFIVAVLTDVVVIAAFCIPYKATYEYFTLVSKMTSTTLGYPMGLVGGSVVIGCTLLILQTLIHLIHLIGNFCKGDEPL